MIEIIAANNGNFEAGQTCHIKRRYLGNPGKLWIAVGMITTVDFKTDTVAVEIMDEEKSKSFLGSAGVGLAGAFLLGPIGLIAGALAEATKQLEYSVLRTIIITLKLN